MKKSKTDDFKVGENDLEMYNPKNNNKERKIIIRRMRMNSNNNEKKNRYRE